MKKWLPFFREQDLWVFRSRRLRWALDLQFRSIGRALVKECAHLPPHARVLDVGAGHAPWRDFLGAEIRYERLESSPRFARDYASFSDMAPDARYDLVLLIEVLEHATHAKDLLRESFARLAPEGRLIVSVPFAARVHRAPNDFCRWTAQGLARLCDEAGIRNYRLHARGSDSESLISQALYFSLARGLSLRLFVLPIALLGWLLCLGSRASETEAENPLGYFLVATRK